MTIDVKQRQYTGPIHVASSFDSFSHRFDTLSLNVWTYSSRLLQGLAPSSSAYLGGFHFEHFEDFVDIPIVFVTVLGHSLTTSASRIFARLLSGLVPPSLWQESLAS